LAVVVHRSRGDGEADRRSAWRSWARERTWEELATGLGVPDLEDLEVTARSPSGRVVGLAAVGRSGTRREWTGFEVRRALELPETLFTFHRLRRSDGTEVVRFLGRGWGHGVGLCQNGAYGLARAGRLFHDILATYYTGIEVVQWQP
jgi:stage II sporulation protein D